MVTINDDNKYSDFEMLMLFNPHYYQMLVNEVDEDKKTLYYQSIVRTDFDNTSGIIYTSNSLDTIITHLDGLDDKKEYISKRYDTHRAILSKVTRVFSQLEKQRLSEYFYNQYNDVPSCGCYMIEQLKEILFKEENEYRALMTRERRLEIAKTFREAQEEKNNRKQVM